MRTQQGFRLILPAVNGKRAAVVVTVAGTICAILFPMDDITGFLYLIGSVFAPMIAVLIADFFVLRRDLSASLFCRENLAVWAVGFVLYRYLMTVDIPCGNTLPDMALTLILAVIVGNVVRKY